LPGCLLIGRAVEENFPKVKKAILEQANKRRVSKVLKEDKLHYRVYCPVETAIVGDQS